RMRRLLLCALLTLAAGPFAAPAVAAGPLVYVENLATTVPQADVDAALPAFQTAVTRDLAPVWGVDATLTTDPKLAASAAMVVQLADDATCMGCLGYHDVVGGRPTSYVFARTSAEYSEAWPLVFMHE